MAVNLIYIVIEHDFVIIKQCRIPREVLKTLGFALGFQHFPWDFAVDFVFKICKVLPTVSKTSLGTLLYPGF